MPSKHSKKAGKAPVVDPGTSSQAIQDQLNRILSHPEFHGTPQQKEFLRFVVQETLGGRENEIKGYTVATQVLGRKENFDATSDPAVSIQASQLRRALERYYLVAGRDDPVRIDIPKGTYVPTFHLQKTDEPDAEPCREESENIKDGDSWPTVLVRPFQNLTEDSEQDFLAIGLATELAVELSRHQDIRVLMLGRGGDGESDTDRVSRFTIEGSVHRDTTGIKVAVHLIDTTTNAQILGDMHRTGMEASQLIAFEEELAQVIAVKVAGEHGVIPRAMSTESRNKPPTDLTTYEAILRYYQYDMLHSVDTYRRALEALQAASTLEPGCGQVWSMLARLYAENITLEYSEVETPLKEGVAFAEKGVLLDPANQRARTALAYTRMLSNEIPAALAEAERALALNPNSLFFMDSIGYLFIHLGEWERGQSLINKAIRLNPYYRASAHYGIWMNWFRQEEYEKAYLETLNFRMTGHFWEPLARAATLGQLERYEEGKQAAEELLKLKPDFPRRGRILIRHYIKFEEIVERVVEGLCKAGVDME